jgi:hypothetical protein
MPEPIPEIPAAEDRQCDIESPSDEQIPRADLVRVWVVLVLEMADIPLLARLEQDGENAKEEKRPDADEDPTGRAADAAAAPKTALESTHLERKVPADRSGSIAPTTDVMTRVLDIDLISPIQCTLRFYHHDQKKTP